MVSTSDIPGKPDRDNESIGSLAVSDMLSQVTPCSDDVRFRGFDFWVGSWDVTNPAGQQVGSNRIGKIQRGCVLVENWTSASGSTGTSYNYFNTREESWHQVWVDSQGNHAVFTGQLVEGAMRFEGRWTNYDGTRSLMKMTFTPLDDGRVRQHIDLSIDDSATYSTWFDGHYTRR